MSPSAPNHASAPREEVHYRLLKLLAEHPQASQRQLAEALGISLGKINYCVKALIDKGWVKVNNFKNNKISSPTPTSSPRAASTPRRASPPGS